MIAVWVLGMVAAGQQPEAPVFSAATEQVRVEVRVTQRGVTLRGLQASDFELWDEGARRQLEAALHERSALDVVLVLDHSGSVVGSKLDALRDAASAFLDGLRPDDRAALVRFNEEVALGSDLTDDRAAVQRALAERPRGGGTALHDALYAALRLRPSGPRRHAVLVFSDGVDNCSWLSHDDVVEAARRSDALVHAVSVRREKTDPPVAILSELATLTGGRELRLHRLEDLRTAFRALLDDLRERYVLRYTPAPEDVHGWHRIEVRLKRRQGDVLARRGYFRD